MPAKRASISSAPCDAALSGKARQIYLVLRNDILCGRIAIGDLLPPETAIASVHGVSRMTARRALVQLAGERLIERRPSAGTRVISDGRTTSIVADISNLVSQIHDMGRKTNVRLLSFGYRDAPAVIAAALRLPEGARIQRAVRVRFVDGEPFSHLTTSVPDQIGRTYDERELGSAPLIQLLERSGIVIARAEQEIGATLAGPDVAEALGVSVGAPLLELKRVVFDAAGQGVEHLHALYRPDRYAFRMDLERTGLDGERSWAAARLHQSTSTAAAGANRRTRTSRNRDGRRR